MKKKFTFLFLLVLGQHMHAQTAFDIAQATIWKYPISKYASEIPLVDEDYIYVGADNSPVVCLDKNTGKEKWKFQVPMGAYPKGFIHTIRELNSEKIVFNGTSKDIFCAGKSDGKMIWRYDCKFDDDLFSKITVIDDCIYVNPCEKNFLAISAAGKLRWKTELKSICTSYTIDKDKIYCQMTDGFCIIDKRNGQLLRSKTIFGESRNQVYAPVCLGNKLYVCNSRDSMVCLDKETLQAKWALASVHGICFENNHLYAWNDTSFHQINPDDGNNIWNLTENFSWYLQPKEFSSVLYLQTRRKFFMIDISSGKTLYSSVYPDKSYTQPIADRELLYLAYAQYVTAVKNPLQNKK